MLRFGIVVSRFNEEYTGNLLEGAKTYLKEEKGITVAETDIFYVPGAFEIPLVAQKLARTGRYSGIICLGCVIKGETAHFEFISLGATSGVMQSMLETETPIAFGILTTYTDRQAFERVGQNSHNKGREAAAACFETVEVLNRIERMKNG